MFILPYNKENQVRDPWVIVVLIALNCAVFVFSLVSPDFEAFLRQFGYIPAQPHAYAIFTSMFTHAGFWHIAGNMFFLWMFGNQVENSFGKIWFSIAYLGSGIVATAAFSLLNRELNQPLVGASGAISGVVGMYVILFPKNKFDLVIYFGWFRIKTIPCTAKLAVWAWFGEQLVLTAVSRVLPSSTAFAAHVGGFLFGVAAGLLFKEAVPEEKQLALAEGKEWDSKEGLLKEQVRKSWLVQKSKEWDSKDGFDSLVTLDLKGEQPQAKKHSVGEK